MKQDTPHPAGAAKVERLRGIIDFLLDVATHEGVEVTIFTASYPDGTADDMGCTNSYHANHENPFTKDCIVMWLDEQLAEVDAQLPPEPAESDPAHALN